MRASVPWSLHLSDGLPLRVHPLVCVCVCVDLTCQEACVDLEAQLAQARELALSLAQEYEGGLIGLGPLIWLVANRARIKSEPY